MRHSARAALLLGFMLAGCADPGADEAWRSRHLFTTEGPIDPALEPPPGGQSDDRPMPLLVQFEGRVRPAWRAAVERSGARVRGYFPENALLVEATPAQAERLAELPALRAVIAQRPTWRIDPRLAAAPAVLQDVLVEIGASVDRPAVEAAIVALGGRVTEAPARWMLRAEVPGEAVRHLAEVPGVVFVEKTPIFRPRNDVARAAVGAEPLALATAGLRGEGQIVGVADTGVDTASCFFAEEKVADWASSSGALEDESGHGTHVAGSIAGDRRSNGRVDDYDGVAPAARLFVQDMASESGATLDGIPNDLGQLFAPAWDAGVRIHSNSWGTSSAVYGPTARSLDAFVAAHPDFLVLAASGNDGPDAGSVGNPAVAKNVIAVGATGNGGAMGQLAAFSSRGPTADGRIKPTLVAPGVRIQSAAAGEACAVMARSGTSMATPIVAGAAALARQYFTDGFHPSGAADSADRFEPSAALLRAVLLAGAAPIDEESGEGAVPSNGQGFGRLDLARSLFFAGEPARERLWIAAEEEPLRLGEVASWELEVGEGGALHVALAWTDAPGASGSTRVLVNDLDLEVIDPAGNSYRGNGLRDGGSNPDGAWDRDNVEEVVHLDDAAPGRYTVRVRAENVPGGAQAFAIAAIGAVEAGVGAGIEPAPPADPDPVEELLRKVEAGGCAASGGGFSIAAFAAAALVALVALRRRRSKGGA